MSQFRKCTGHSEEARPPTGEEDTRCAKQAPWTFPKVWCFRHYAVMMGSIDKL